MELIGGERGWRRERDFSGTLGRKRWSLWGKAADGETRKRNLDSLDDSRQRLAGVARLAWRDKTAKIGGEGRDFRSWITTRKPGLKQLNFPSYRSSSLAVYDEQGTDSAPDCEIGHGERMANA